MNRLKQLLLNLRSSLWFVPAVMVGGGVVLALGLIEMDSRVDRGLAEDWPRLFGAGSEGSRLMLSAIAGSMITVAGVIFSITMVALSQASSQFTPRILRNFMRDRGNQFVLGAFVGVFVYCLIVLRTIHSSDERRFVPALAVTFAVVLAFFCIGVLIYFIHHIANSLQASTIIAEATRETVAAIERLFPEELGEGADDEEEKDWSGFLRAHEWQAVPAAQTGYIQGLDTEGLLRFARERGVVVRMERAIGEFVVAATPLVSLTLNVEPGEKIDKEINALFSINDYRTVDQDAGFGIRQLVDIALKALSTGVNDTSTAVICVDHLGAILTHLARRRIATRYRSDGEQLRVIAKGPTFASMVAASFDQIRENAAGNVGLLARMLRALVIIAGQTTSPRRRKILLQQVHLIAATADRTVETTYDRARVREWVERALTALAEEPRGHTLMLLQEVSD